MGIWYATRGAVKAALDVKETARANAQVDRAIESASRTVESLLHRRFYPETTTRYFDWPNASYARSWRLWLDANELVSLTSLVSGDVTLDPSDYFLRRADNRDEPPYDSIELSLDGDAAFGQGSTWQKDIAVTGVFGYDDVRTTAGALDGSVDSSQTTVTVTDATVDVGDLLTVGTERMQVLTKAMADTGVSFSGLTTARADDDTLAVPDGTAFTVGEVLRLDSERCLVVDVAEDNLVLKRAWDGSRLAAHTSGSIYAARQLVVTRGALGTTAASHTDAAAVSRQVYPGPVVALCVAESLSTLQNELAGYAHTSGSGDSSTTLSVTALQAARDLAVRTCGRRARTRAV